MIHGGDIYTHKVKTGVVPLDFSANINPLGMPKAVRSALEKSVGLFERYPDIECRELKKATSKKENVHEESMLFGNGAADLIFRIVFSLKPQKALLLAPTFFEYEAALTLQNCKIDYYNLLAKNDFMLQDDFLDKIIGHDIVFLCNPNNPTGNVANREFIEKVALKCKICSSILVIDECFMDFVKEENEITAKTLLSEFSNIIILKAFTKMYALAGVRLGYCLSSNIDLLQKIKNIGQPWNVSVPAQIAGVAACGETEFVRETVCLIEKEREYLVNCLRPFVKEIYSSYVNFLLFKADVDLAHKLVQKNILIRECSNFYGLDSTYFRIAVRTHEENEKLIGAIKNG